jgi:type IV secretory pathway protease TraF
MGVFFIDTAQGIVATQHQLIAAGIAPAAGIPPRPWLRVQGTGDASTMWYAVMRKRERGVFIGTLVLRHSPHHALLLRSGWEEVPVDGIGVGAGQPG